MWGNYKVMKIQINTTDKTIRIDETVTFNDLIKQLDKLFPNEEWKKYKVEPFSWNYHPYYTYYPYYQGTYTPASLTTYGSGVITNDPRTTETTDVNEQTQYQQK